VGQVEALGRYLGVTSPPGRIPAIVERCSIKHLRDDVVSRKLRTPLVDREKKPFAYRKGERARFTNYGFLPKILVKIN